MKDENRASERGSDNRKGSRGSETVKEIEKVGGSTGIRFPVHQHHEHCDVHGPGGNKGTAA